MAKTLAVAALLADSGVNAYRGAGTNYLIQTTAGVLYLVGIDEANDVSFVKSTDGGVSWSDKTSVYVGSTLALSVWYDGWSGLGTGMIHIAYTSASNDDILYRKLSTADDSLTSEVQVLAGGSAAGGGCLSISVSRGGNIYVAGNIDTGTEVVFARSTDNGTSFGARTTPFEAVGSDQIILMPGFAADNQDMMAFFWDASADEISRKLYDDSANSWAETSIATGMVDVAAASTTFPHFAACVDLANSRNFLVAWSAVDAANADLRCFYVTESAITEVTNVVLNSTDDQGLCGIGIDTVTGELVVYYAGKSDGSETWNTSVKVYSKRSTDYGTNWSGEVVILSTLVAGVCPHLFSCPRYFGFPRMAFEKNNPNLSFNVLAPLGVPKATAELMY